MARIDDAKTDREVFSKVAMSVLLAISRGGFTSRGTWKGTPVMVLPMRAVPKALGTLVADFKARHGERSEGEGEGVVG